MAATKPVDFGKGAEGPAALARETMTADRGLRVPAKRADRDKLVFGMIHIDHLENHLVIWDGQTRTQQQHFRPRLV